MKEFNVIENIGTIMQGVQKGVLLTTKSGDTTNTMAISWGAVGIEWGKPVFITFIREGRFSRSVLDENLEFTVNIASDPEMNNKMIMAGRSSGREGDKIAKIGLTTVPAQEVSVPAVKEFPITLECRVVTRMVQGADTYTEYGQDYKTKMYPQDVPSTAYGPNKDFGVTYIAEIVKAYVLEDE